MSTSEPTGSLAVDTSEAPDSTNHPWCGTLDRILIVTVVALAALLAAGLIRNSDLWQHLASGRLLAERPSALGEEPFLHTAADSRWVNHGWLFDLASYAVHTATGEVGLWTARLLVVLLLTVIVLYAGHVPGTSWWASASLTALTLLAAAPRFGWEPRLVSLAFLALTVALLERRVAGIWSKVWLLGLFALWANVDGWFLLGPLAVFCYWLGGLATQRTVPFWLVPVSAMVGLLNPSLQRAFVLPAELTFPLTHGDLANVPFFRSLFLSPLGADFYLAGTATTWAGLAFLALVALGLISFAANRSARPWDRALLWLALLALAAYQSRNAPFFAVVAGPLAALNFQQFAMRRRSDEHEPRPRQAVIGRLGTVVAGLALLALAAVGRLPPAAIGSPAMGIEVEPSLVRAATRLAEARARGLLSAGALGFNLVPEAAQYCAWFCPAEKGFFDTRLEVSAPSATDFAVVHAALTGSDAPAGAADWRTVLRRHGVDHLIVYDRDTGRTGRALTRLSAEPGEWVLLLQAGRVAVFGRGKQSAHGRFAAPGADPAERAYRPGKAEQAPATAPPMVESAWWAPLLPPSVAPSLDRDEATMQLLLFEARKDATRREHLARWEAALAVGALGGVSPIAGLGGRTSAALLLDWQRAARSQSTPGDEATPTDRLAVSLRDGFLYARDEAPAGHLWAAVRAARRRLADDPLDARAQLLLGKAYCRLAWHTHERSWGPVLPLVSQLRRQQALAALNAALRLDPSLDLVHRDLADLYRELRYFDLAMLHLRAYRAAIPTGDAAVRRARLEETDRQIATLERDLSRAEAEYQLQAGALGAAARAHLAERLGLGKQALEQLLAIDVAGFGRQGMLTQLELMLCTGRDAQARAWIDPSTHKDFLGFFEYHWLQTRLAAAAGDYVAVEANLAELSAGPGDDPVAGLTAAVAAEVLRGAMQASATVPYVAINPLATRTYFQVLGRTQALREEVSLNLLRGLMQLERGDVDRAEQLFRRARDLSAREPEGMPGASAAAIARQLLAQLAVPENGGR